MRAELRGSRVEGGVNVGREWGSALVSRVVSGVVSGVCKHAEHLRACCIYGMHTKVLLCHVCVLELIPFPRDRCASSAQHVVAMDPSAP